MFRRAKPKKNKRRRVIEDEDEPNIDGSITDDDYVTAASMATERRSINTFSTGGIKKAKNVIQTRLIKSEREIVPQQYAGDATYEAQIDTEKDRDARAVLERSIKVNQDGSADADSGKVYRGQAAYKSYITKKESQIGMNKYTGTQGPIRAQTWARAISRFDYQPDISGGKLRKNTQRRKRTVRSDSKQGETLIMKAMRKKRMRLKKSSEEQFACTICRRPFRNAVETICGHFFCEACALKHFKKSSRCFNCKKQTSGVFNAAEELRVKEREQRVGAIDTSNDTAYPTIDAEDNAGRGWTKVAEAL
ncbi:unnamed protein product [Peronospora belbahrii]|uniref:RING-type domain-containing protein n=1 Tax=Peronospora belbahrii TaxID=622444 RepID=A0AAU9KNQ8_9STRA|nr:unnamed protein product [Peronospora belbahrii]